MLAEPIVIAYAFVVILRNFKRVKKFIVGVLFCIIVTLVGRNMYRDTQLVFAENAYKIPNEMIEISQLVTNAECEPCVVAVDTIPIWIRQYDASIDMLYGRYGESELRALVNDASRDYEKLYDILSKRECNILIIRNNEISNEEIYQYGFEYIGCTEHYALYKLV